LDVVKKEISNALISALPLSIAFVDIDHFKEINDSYGHEAGDTCLSYLALQCRRYLPKGCYIGRMGGDEFLFVFPNYFPDQVKQSLDATVASIETLIIDDQECTFTLSIGIAQFKPNEMDLKGLLREADETLYLAKENGRNQITIAA
jgi:diguanylate cyclase (GGDEF)-like protein